MDQNCKMIRKKKEGGRTYKKSKNPPHQTFPQKKDASSLYFNSSGRDLYKR